MTAVKKSQLLEKLTLTEEQQKEYNELEELLNRKLSEGYAGNPITIELQSFPSPKVKLQIEREFSENGGWKIQFKESKDFHDAHIVKLK